MLRVGAVNFILFFFLVISAVAVCHLYNKRRVELRIYLFVILLIIVANNVCINTIAQVVLARVKITECMGTRVLVRTADVRIK